MSGMEPMIIGAVAGAATNRDDPFKGALMGAALGGLGGGLLSNAAGAAGGAAEGAVASEALPAGLSNLSMGPSGLMPVDTAPVRASELGFIGNLENAGIDASIGQAYGQLGVNAADLGWMDRISPSQQLALGTNNIPGSYDPYAGVIGYEEAAGKELAKAQAKDIMMRGGGMPSLGGAMSALSQSQPRAQMQSPGGIRRGQPQAVNYGGLASLLEPKLVERRRLSLL